MLSCGCQCSLYLPLWRHGLVCGLCLWHFLAILICFGRFYLVLLNEINKTESDTFNIKWALVCGVWLWVLSLFHWYPGSGVVLGCEDSWSLHPCLLSVLKLSCISQVFKKCNKQCNPWRISVSRHGSIRWLETQFSYMKMSNPKTESAALCLKSVAEAQFFVPMSQCRSSDAI